MTGFYWHVLCLLAMSVITTGQPAIDPTTTTQGVCETGRFGRNCRLSCHCLGANSCERSRGKCALGCSPPWRGSTCQKQNVAFSKPTFQSSTLRSLGTLYSSDRGVNGNANWPQCSHTEREINPYWTVDLVLPTTIYHARIFNRDDCCQARLTGFQVYVSNSRDLASATLCYASPNTQTPQVLIDIQCTTPVIGRYVSVVIPRLGYVTLCDVEIYECADYTFGRDCVGECHCLNEQEICDKRTGVCKSGCAAGWTGDTCQSVCPDYKFGQDCLKQCQCQQFNEICDKITGFCQSGCLSGRGGAGCQTECEDYRFGMNCAERCRCMDRTEICDKVTGQCLSGCAPGWSGQDCSVACPANTYGIDCLGTCRCRDPLEPCDKLTGFCSSGCATGWIGDSCQNECPDGTFGSLCEQKCNCYDIEEICDKETGDCQSGCSGETRGTGCSGGKFGPLCEQRCNCYDSEEICDKETGDCQSGCSGETRGTGCSECPPARYGPLCKKDCLCLNVTEQCDRVTGFCISGCMNDPSSNICSEPVKGAAQRLSSEAVGGIICGIVVVLLLIMITFLVCMTRRKTAKKTPTPRPHYENCGPEFSAAATVSIGNGSIDQHSTYENVEVPEAVYQNCKELENSNTMDAEVLFDYVQGLLKDKEQMQKNFEEIPVPLTPSNVAVQPENIKNNRYRHVLPFDRTRVVLFDPEDDGTDYINASYIDGYNRPRAYIATQGPVSSVIGDFWKMIWQEKSGKIVMLTNLMEAGRRKCEQYWPEEGSMTFGNITVEHVAMESFAHFKVRSFKLSKGTDVKTVNQFHFQSWSDHDAPNDTIGILHFRDKIRDTNTESPGPTVIHCSAGVGRTGTYIALDILIESAQKEGMVAIDDCIHKLRGQRMHMIQNSTQYEFLHKALRDAILCANSSVLAARFLEDCIGDDSSIQERIREEFMALGKFKCLETRKKEVVYEKMTKNRSEDIIASDAHRVFLSTNIEDTTNYINAIFVPSFYKRHGLIITQTPMASTVIDFWRLIYEQKSSTIIVLQENPNEMEETYIPRSSEGLVVGPFQVTIEDFSRLSTTLATRTLKLVYDDGNTKESMTVKQFCFMDWKAGDVTPSSPDSVISLLELVTDWQRECGRGETVVHCLNGAFRSGIYAACNMILERLRSEQVVNVMQTVHQLRSIRPQFIYTPEQYRFCYDVAKAFLQNFHGYQNFN